MVGRSTILYASILTLLLPTALAATADDAAGDQLAPFPDNYDILSVDLRAQGGDLVVTFTTAGSMLDGPSGHYMVQFSHDGYEHAVMCWTENPDLFDVEVLCYGYGSPDIHYAEPEFSADGTSWTLRVPLAYFGLGANDSLDDARASTRPVVGSRFDEPIPGPATAQPVDLDELVFPGAVKLTGA